MDFFFRKRLNLLIFCVTVLFLSLKESGFSEKRKAFSN